MQMLDEINTMADGTGTWPRGTEGFNVPTHGTSTVRPRVSTRQAIPDSFIESDQVYKSQNGTGEMTPSPRTSQSQVKPPTFKPAPLYEPKGQTLPGANR